MFLKFKVLIIFQGFSECQNDGGLPDIVGQIAKAGKKILSDLKNKTMGGIGGIGGIGGGRPRQ